MPTSSDVDRFRNNWQEEIESAARYRALAEAETRPGVATVYRDLAGMEEKHAAFWAQRLTDAGVSAGPPRLGWRTRFLVWLARRFGAFPLCARPAPAGEAEHAQRAPDRAR